MSDAELESLVKLFNPSFVCKLPDVGHGLAAAASYRHFFELRMQRHTQQGALQQPVPTSTFPLEIAVDATTRRTLQSIAERASTPDNPLDVGKVAAAMLQNIAGKVNASSENFGQLITELQDQRT